MTSATPLQRQQICDLAAQVDLPEFPATEAEEDMLLTIREACNEHHVVSAQDAVHAIGYLERLLQKTSR
jgi:hypothetical protein